MTFVCPTCKKDCRPIATNVAGMGVEIYTEDIGWKIISDTFETKCLAEKELVKYPKNNHKYRVYDVFDEVTC